MRIDLRRPNSMVAHMALQRLPTGDRVKSGAFDYLVKPFDPRTIVMRVSAAITGFAKRNSRANDGDIAATKCSPAFDAGVHKRH